MVAVVDLLEPLHRASLKLVVLEVQALEGILTKQVVLEEQRVIQRQEQGHL
jgi:hypothetical protein